MHRFLFLTAFLAFSLGHAYTQKTCAIIIKTDTSTKTRKAETSLFAIGKENDNLYCSAFRSGSSFGIYFNLEIWNKTICFKPGSRAIIIFDDLSKIQVTNDQSTNCKGNFFITGAYGTSDEGDKSPIFNALGAKIIKAIRFYTNEGFVDYDVAEDDDSDSMIKAEEFRSAIACLKSDW